MKYQSIKIALLSTLLLSVAGFSGLSSAHTVTSTITSTSISAKDIYRTMCFSWNNGIHPTAPAGEVNGAATSFFTSVTGANATITNYGGTFGSGVHYFAVGRSNTSGTVSYTATFHCQNASSAHTGTGETFTGVPVTAGGAGVSPTVDFIQTQNQ